MALDVETGKFIRQAGTGNQVVSLSDTGLVGKIIEFYGSEQLAQGFVSDCSPFHGFAASSTERGCYAYFVGDALTSPVGATRGDNANCIVILSDATPTIGGEADFVSFGTGEFTINWGTNDGVRSDIYYKIYGGSDLTDVFVGSMNIVGSTTGQFSNTALSFTPKLIKIIGMTKLTTLPSNQTKYEKSFFGCAASSTKRWCAGISNKVTIGQSLKVASNFDDTNIIIAVKSPTQLEMEIDFVSFNTAGFTLDTIVAKGDFQSIFMCMGGNADFEVDVGTDTQRITTIGTKATTTAFKPQDLFLATCSQVDGGAADAKSIFGGSDGTNEWTQGIVSEDNPATDSKCDNLALTTKVLRMATPGQPPTTDAEADFDSFNATDFTLDWTTVDGVAREFGWCVMKGAAAAGGAILGSTSISITPAGDLKGSGALVGSETVTLSDAALLTGKGPLAGAESVVISESAALTGKGVLAGAESITLSQAGDLQAIGDLAGAVSLILSQAAGLTGKGALLGAESIVFSDNATLTSAASGDISGTTALALSIAANLQGKGVLLGAESIVISDAANLQGNGALLGAVSIALSEAANLQGKGILLGSESLVLSNAALITGKGALNGAVTITLSDVAGLSGLGALVSAINITIATVGDLTAASSGAIAGATTISLSAVGDIAGLGALLSSEIITISPNGVLSGLGALAGSESVSFSLSGDLKGIGQLLGNETLVITNSGLLAAIGSLSGSELILFSPVGDLTDASAFRVFSHIHFANILDVVNTSNNETIHTSNLKIATQDSEK